MNCPHECWCCFAIAYQRKEAAGKQSFSRLLSKDLNDLEYFDVPPAPVHISNSTDPFQPLEKRFDPIRSLLTVR
jgi:DNA repair photolyase